MNMMEKIVLGMQMADLPSTYWSCTNIEVPELEKSKTTIQKDSRTVYDHTMSVIDLLTDKNSITLMSGLFHDLGKTYINPIQNFTLRRFPGHEIESAKIADVYMTKWGASSYIKDRVIRIISTHMFDVVDATREKTLRKFVASIGIDNIDNWFVVRISDSRSYSAYYEYKYTLIDPFRKAVIMYLNKQPNLGEPHLEQSDDVRSMQIEGRDGK